jgi:mRNA interferase RelE/StbE
VQTPQTPRVYEVRITNKAESDLANMRPDTAKRAWAKIQALAQDPRPDGCRKLAGFDNRWRIRVGEWRVIYEVYDKQLVVLVISAPPRGKAYR